MSAQEEATPSPDPVESTGAKEIEMRRRAAAVLEVLGGAKTPTEAAEAIGISLPSYYLLEARALQGLILFCEARPRGRSSGESRTIESLRRENERLRHDLTRTQALARAVQRAAGMPANEDGAPRPEGRARRRRRPQARALRAARHLAPSPETPSAPATPKVEPPPSTP